MDGSGAITEATPKPKRKGEAILDPIRAAQAAASLIESIRAMGDGGDDELLVDMVEGETEFFEIVDKLVERRTETLALADGLDRAIDNLKARKEAFEKRADADKALIEQGLMVAGLPGAQRPCATLSLTKRQPALVIDEEAEIPAAYWVAGDPRLDKKALREACAVRFAAEVDLPEDPEARALAVAALPAPIPGARLEAVAPTLTIRVR